MKRMRSVALVFVFLLPACGGHVSNLVSSPTTTAVKQPAILPQVLQNGTETGGAWKAFAPHTVSGVYRGMVVGPDKNVYFGDDNAGRLARISMSGGITEFPLTFNEGGVRAFSPDEQAVGADGKIYVVCDSCLDPITGGGMIGRTSTSGGFVKFNIPSKDTTTSNGLGLGPDGNVWVAERGHIAKITTAGGITERAYPSGETQNIDSHPVAGPDGNVWFTEYFKAKVAHINPATLAITEIDVLNKCGSPHGMSVGPDKNLYFICGPTLAKVTTGGVVSPISIAGHGSALTAEDVMRGPNNNIWFAAGGTSNELGEYNTSTHALTFHDAPVKTGIIAFIVSGPDGNVWGAEGSIHIDVFILATLTASPNPLSFTAIGQVKTLTATYHGPSVLSAVSANTAIVTVTAGAVHNTFNITSHALGNTTVTVKDAIGNSFVVTVHVT